MRQALLRRYEKLLTGPSRAPERHRESRRPDPDRRRQGPGRLARDGLAELGLSNIPLLGVAKGEDRKPGLETLVFADGREPLHLPRTSGAAPDPGDPRRGASLRHYRPSRPARQGRRTSRLEDVAGIGPKRRKASCRASAACRVANAD